MATLYFKLEQRATVGSPTTGSTIYMAWPDASVPSGLNRTDTVNFLSTYPNSTWSFRSRTWLLTNLGSTPISFDTQMISGEPWSSTQASINSYVGNTFNINTTFFNSRDIASIAAFVNISHPKSLCELALLASTVKTVFSIKTPWSAQDCKFPVSGIGKSKSECNSL